MNWRQKRQLQQFIITAFSYSIFWTLFMGVIQVGRGEQLFGSWLGLISSGIFFGIGMGLWELFYKKTDYIEGTTLTNIQEELKNLNFKKVRVSKGGTIFYTRKAHEKWGFHEDLEVYEGEDAIEIKSLRKYVDHLKKKFNTVH